MNPWNRIWIGLAWLMTACGVAGTYLGHEPNMAAVVAVILAVLITAQTIGCDRAEQQFDADLQAAMDRHPAGKQR